MDFFFWGGSSASSVPAEKKNRQLFVAAVPVYIHVEQEYKSENDNGNE